MKVLLSGGFAHNVAIITSGTALGQAISALAAPILTRLYTPDALGIWSMYMSLFLMLAVVVNWRYENAIVLPSRDEDATILQLLSVIIAVLMSGLALFVVVLFRHQVAQLLGIAEIAQWFWLLPIILILKGLYQAGSLWSTRKKHFIRLSASQVSQPLSSLVSQVGAGLIIGSNPVGLIIGTFVGQLAAIGALGKDAWQFFSRLLPNAALWSSLRENVIRYKNFPLYKAPYSFAGVFAKRSIYLLMGMFAAAHDVGLFAIAMKATFLPVGAISSALRQVFYQRAPTDLRSGRLELHVVKILTWEMLIATPLLVFAAFNIRWIFEIIFGNAWAGVGIFAVFLIFPSFFYLFASWPDRLYDVLGRQRLALVMQLIYGVLSITAFGLSLFWLKNVVWTVGLYSGITTLYYIVLLLVTFKMAEFSSEGLLHLGKKFLLLVTIAGALHWAMTMVLPVVVAAVTFLALMILYYLYLGLRYGKSLK